MKKTVAVIYGGRSGEHEVSLVSGRAVIDALDRKRFRILPVFVTKDGRWKVGEKGRPGPVTLGQGTLNGRRVDVAFPVIHGTYGEDGRLQGLLDMAGIPYVGCGVEASAVCMDKDAAKRLLADAGIPVAKGIVVADAEWTDSPRRVLSRAAEAVGFPCFVKPARLGSSVGVTKAKERGDLPSALRTAFSYDDKALVEAAVPNAREIECAVLGNGPYDVAGPGEVMPAGEFYDFHDKYVDGRSSATIPADLPKGLSDDVRTAAAEACRVLGVEGFARVDFLMPKGSRRWVLNEINTLPGFTSISMYPKLWAHEGKTFKRLVSDLVRLALERSRAASKKTTSFDSGSDWHKAPSA